MNGIRHKHWIGLAVLAVCSVALSAKPQSGAEATTQPMAGDPGPSPTLGAKPSQADDKTAILFDGSSWRGWQRKDGPESQWIVQDDGSVQAAGVDAVTNSTFGDFQLHVEFYCPKMSGKQGQARSNSGVYLHGRYEIQVLDSFGDPPTGNGCGALYSIAAPMVNASRPPGTWQTYDIIFRAPRFDDQDKITELPRLTVLHNGIVIHNNLELPSTTPGGLDRTMVDVGPILLQFHGDPVRYRNIWLRTLD